MLIALIKRHQLMTAGDLSIVKTSSRLYIFFFFFLFFRVIKKVLRGEGKRTKDILKVVGVLSCQRGFCLPH